MAAWVAALSAIQNPPKNKTNPHFKQKYADLASIADTARNALGAHGLAVYQPINTDQSGGLHVATMVMHKSGNVVAESCITTTCPDDPQKFGSKVTYLRRYALSALLGIAADDDDDAEATKERKPAPRAAAQGGSTPAPTAAPEGSVEHHPSWKNAYKAFFVRLGDLGLTYPDVSAFCEAKGRPRPSQMDPEGRLKLVAFLESEEGKAEAATWKKA